MFRDFIQNLLQRGLRLPVPLPRSQCGIQHHPRNVERAGTGIFSNIVLTETRTAPIRKLRERPAAGSTATEVLHAHLASAITPHLREQHRDEITRMQAVANLAALAVEADVSQRTSAQMGIDPKLKDTLVGFAKLSSASQHAAFHGMALDHGLTVVHRPPYFGWVLMP